MTKRTVFKGSFAAPVAIIVAIVAMLTLNACGANSSPSHTQGQPLNVVAAFYPLQYAAEQVGGDNVKVTSLTPPGVEPHDLELTAAQVAEIRNADTILYIPGFQPALDAAIEQQAPNKAVDITQNITLLHGANSTEQTDPHVWLNPDNMTIIGENIKEALTTVDPSVASELVKGENNLKAKMAALAEEFITGLKSCKVKDMIVSHEAFGYLAKAYGFTQVGISGLNPDAEPSLARVKEVADIIKANGVTTVYYETLVDPKIAQTVAKETNTKIAPLDPIEGLAPNSNGDYVSIMKFNLATLKAGQNC